MNYIVLFNSRKSVRTRNDEIFKNLQGKFHSRRYIVYFCEDQWVFIVYNLYTSNLLQKVSKDSHDAIVSFCISCFCAAFNRYSWSMYLCDFFQGFSEVHLNSDEQKILEFKKQKVDFWYLMTFLFVCFVVYRQMFYTKLYILNPIKPGLF